MTGLCCCEASRQRQHPSACTGKGHIPLRLPALPASHQTFTNDPSGDFSKWASNPRVVGMLREAQRLMDEG